MKKVNVFAFLLLAGVILLSGCKTSNTAKSTEIGAGAAIGAGVGALIGGKKGATVGAEIGMKVGAKKGATCGESTGAIIGNKMDKHKAELERIQDTQVVSNNDGQAIKPQRENCGVVGSYEQNDITEKQTDSQTYLNNESVKDSTVNNYSNPDNDNLLDMEDYTSFIAWNSANTCYREGNYAEAIEYYQKVTIKNRPSVVWKNIGICYQRLKMYDDAITYFRKCNEGSTWYSMGLCYKEKNNYAKTIECMQKAAQLGYEEAQNILKGMNKKW